MDCLLNDKERVVKIRGNMEHGAKNRHELCENDFLPIEDDRMFCSGIDDVDGGDDFTSYIEWFYDLYEEDIFEVETIY